ncbi:hypothetical protein QBC38DRAFT_124885 [Podospora fimiseda]|uniref:Uncharacterized protein n=1 Tax=Podospora fimiseda TaxID=252190 RepID=A0AAN7BTN2_9PEZI|nr:hypothetical protein QBC38DRAFT_124885 [Podospora fimiseda]
MMIDEGFQTLNPFSNRYTQSGKMPSSLQGCAEMSTSSCPNDLIRYRDLCDLPPDFQGRKEFKQEKDDDVCLLCIYPSFSQGNPKLLVRPASTLTALARLLHQKTSTDPEKGMSAQTKSLARIFRPIAARSAAERKCQRRLGSRTKCQCCHYLQFIAAQLRTATPQTAIVKELRVTLAEQEVLTGSIETSKLGRIGLLPQGNNRACLRCCTDGVLSAENKKKEYRYVTFNLTASWGK